MASIAPTPRPMRVRAPIEVIELALFDLEELARDMRQVGRARPSTELLEEEARRIGAAVRGAFR